MKRRIFFTCIFLCLLAVLLLYLDNTLVKLTRYTVRSSEIPQEFDGFKIIQLSDIHGAEFGDGNLRLIDKIERTEPDAILITGDIVNNQGDDEAEAEIFDNIMTELDGVAPMYAVTGNHDEMNDEFYSYIDKWEREHNIRWLNNETVTLTSGESSIYLSGIDDPKIWSIDERTEKVREAMASMEVSDGYNILMFHRADMLDMFIDSQYDIVFFGTSAWRAMAHSVCRRTHVAKYGDVSGIQRRAVRARRQDVYSELRARQQADFSWDRDNDTEDI